MLSIIIPITMIVIKILKITGQIFSNTVLYTTHPGLNVTCVSTEKTKTSREFDALTSSGTFLLRDIGQEWFYRMLEVTWKQGRIS